MRTEEQDWQDLEKKLNPKTIYIPKHECTLVRWFKNFFLKKKV